MNIFICKNFQNQFCFCDSKLLILPERNHSPSIKEEENGDCGIIRSVKSEGFYTLENDTKEVKILKYF